MAHNLPYLAAPGSLPKILNKIIEASVPESFNANFLGTKLGFPGGNQRAFISWAKKCGFLNSDGTPTQLYKDFRNSNYRGQAMAEAIKKGYGELYLRNEYAHELSKHELVKVISEITGSAHDSSVVKNIVYTYNYAKDFADFEVEQKPVIVDRGFSPDATEPIEYVPVNQKKSDSVSLGINYTINLVLPKTDDPAIFNAIFKSLKENLLNE